MRKRLRNGRQLSATRDKLDLLQAQYDNTKNRPGGNEHVRELVLGSLARRIKQLREEVIWYESQSRVGPSSGPAVASSSNKPEGTSSPCTN
jgi:hypothetical protein